MGKPHPILFLVGVALSIAQFVMIRDFVSILYGEEVVIVLVTASFFFALSVGYVLALRVSAQAFRRLFVLSVFLHLSFPFSYRYLASGFSVLDAGGYAYLALLFCYAVIFNAVFASFLPRLVSLSQDEETSEGGRLRVYYGLELAGFMSGFLLVALSWNQTAAWLLGPYWLILGVVLFLTIRHVPVTALYGGLAIAVLIFLDPLDKHSTALLYAYKHHIAQAKVLFSVNSPYQKVEVVEDNEGRRYLYLDGLLNLNSTDLESLNYYIAELPAALVRPEHTLLIGNGTLSSAPKVYPYSQRVTSVELDGGVLAAGRRFFTRAEELIGLDRWTLHVDDGKHFLRKSDDRYGLIVVDVPSPLTIQEAYLHTVEFYRLGRERLVDGGVIAVQLSGPLQKNNRTPARVTAALREVFPEVMVIYSEKADRGFAYGSTALPFTARGLRERSRSYETGIEIIPPERVDEYLTRATPLALDTMDLVLRRGWQRFADRYFRD